MLFGEEHQELRRSLRRLIDQEINPYVDEWEEAEIFPAKEVFKKLGDAGFLGINKPEEFGGLGLDYSYALAAAEEMGHVKCGGIPTAVGVQTDMATPALSHYGSDELRREFLVPSIAGDMVACLGISEPSAGSDVRNIKTNARKDGDDYIINGSKTWITSGVQGDWICLLTNTGEGNGYDNKTLICVPLDAPGVQVARKIKKIGMFSSDTATLYFDDVRVPQRYRIGEEGRGFIYQMEQFQEERMCGAAVCLLAMDETIEETIEYTRDRQIFGQSVLDNQVVHFTLTELQVEVEALRALIYRSAEGFMAGDDMTRLASMAKLKAGRTVREVADKCLQYWGGMGYTWENRASRLFRDGRVVSIGGGADEVMLAILAKMNGTLPARQQGKNRAN